MWIYEHPDFPNFTWNANVLAPFLEQYEQEKSALIAMLHNIGFDLREAQTEILAEEIINTSKIEAVYLNRSSVLASVANCLNYKEITGKAHPTTEQTERLAEMMMDAITNKSPITVCRLMEWHRGIFSGYKHRIQQVGAWRKHAVQIVSQTWQGMNVKYVAPAPEMMEDEMARLLEWIEKEGRKQHPIVCAATAHLWFESIHPYEDGNGRVGRALSEYLLARDDVSDFPKLISVSSQIYRNVKLYYSHLESNTKDPDDMDITEWLVWFAEMTIAAVRDSKKVINRILKKTAAWDKIRNIPLTHQQTDLINRMLDGKFKETIQVKKYASMYKMDRELAFDQIWFLEKKRILVPNTNGNAWRFQPDLSQIDNENDSEHGR